MTIERKIFTAGAITFFIFVGLALMNIWTHQQVLSNLRIRDDVNAKLAGIQKFDKWKNELIRSVSDIVSSGRVPPFIDEKFDLPFEWPTEEGDALLKSGKALVSLVGEKEHATGQVEKTFNQLRMNINGLYYKLDKEIATILAKAQLDQVLGIDVPEKSSLAPYVLKSLNQLTLVALNSIISRNYSEEEKGVVARNRQFLLAQLHTIDTDGNVAALFNELFLLIQLLETFILDSRKTLDGFNSRIAEARNVFDKAAGETSIETIIANAQSEVEKANEILEKASRRNLITVIIFLMVGPILLIAVGIIGLNKIIVEPITHLVDAMKNVETGSFDVTAPVKTNDEIGKLARAFNAMAVEIKAKVTEMSRLNQILKESESKYRSLVDNLPQRIFLKNNELVYVSCNRNFARDLGLAEDEIVGKTDFDFFPEAIAEKYRDDDKRILLTEATEEIEELYPDNENEIIVQTIKTPIRNEQGQVAGVLGIFWDITERKRAEEELQLSRFSLENASVATFWIDSEGLIQYVNERTCKNLGYSRNEMLGMPIWNVDPEFTKERYARYWHDMSDGEPVHFESTHRRKDGFIFPVEISFRQGEFKGVRLNFAFINDISYRAQAEEEKQKLQLQLQQSRKMEAIGTLAGGIAHDFNNLLQAVSGYTEILLLNKHDNDPDYANLTAVKKAGERAAQLVKQLLFFSRKAETEKKSIKLNREIEQVIKILERTIPKMIDIEVHLANGLWAVSADPLQIEQILLNLGSNAADAMPDGGKLIIETENVLLDKKYTQNHVGVSPGRHVLLTVSDTGYGMDKETVGHIFEPFFTTKGIGQGTGLGLASVYGIVKSHGGHIVCYSEVGRGTSFKIYLQAIESSREDETADAAGKPPIGGTETILLVDDESAIRDFALQILEKFDYTVLTASSGEEALEIYAARLKDIDLVILDIGMPGMGGFKCLSEIVKLHPSAKVLIASGYSINGQAQKTLEAGAVGFVGKPYQLADLLNKIRAVLDGEK